MTLQEWADRERLNPLTYEDARIIPVSYSKPDLWRLRDYRVTSVIGGSVWLIPRGSL